MIGARTDNKCIFAICTIVPLRSTRNHWSHLYLRMNEPLEQSQPDQVLEAGAEMFFFRLMIAAKLLSFHSSCSSDFGIALAFSTIGQQFCCNHRVGKPQNSSACIPESQGLVASSLLFSSESLWPNHGSVEPRRTSPRPVQLSEKFSARVKRRLPD